MSEQAHADHDEHEAFIKTPQQLIAVVILSFVVPVILIIMLTQLVTGSHRSEARTMSTDAVRARIQPIAGFNLVDANAPRVLKTGQQVYDGVCTACHAATAAIPNSPKVGDRKAWGPLIKEGLAKITSDAIKGVGAMPPRGGNPDLSDIELQRAIVYMANQAGAGWKEPGEAAAAVAPAAPAVGMGGLPAKVFFETGKAGLNVAAQKTVDGALVALKDAGTTKVDITGFTDKTGNRDQNLELAKERAKAVRAALEKAGVANERINMKPPMEITGSGNDAEARRVEINLAK